MREGVGTCPQMDCVDDPESAIFRGTLPARSQSRADSQQAKAIPWHGEVNKHHDQIRGFLIAQALRTRHLSPCESLEIVPHFFTVGVSREMRERSIIHLRPVSQAHPHIIDSGFLQDCVHLGNGQIRRVTGVFSSGVQGRGGRLVDQDQDVNRRPRMQRQQKQRRQQQRETFFEEGGHGARRGRARGISGPAGD